MLGRIPKCCVHPQAQEENAYTDEKCRTDRGRGRMGLSNISDQS